MKSNLGRAKFSGAQCAQILSRLRRGTVTSNELALIARRYTNRISDLRAQGHVIQCQRVDGGMGRYTLIGRRAEFGNLELL